jgi:hypothetical protein
VIGGIASPIRCNPIAAGTKAERLTISEANDSPQQSRRFRKMEIDFDSHVAAHREAGLKLEHLWRSIGDPNEVIVISR